MDVRTDMSKSTNAQLELRVSTVAEMIIKGQGRDKILRYGSKEWNVSDRQIDEYLAKAWEKIGRNTDYDIKREIKLQRARFEDLYQKNYTIQDYREARQVLDSIAKMLGLNQPEKLNMSGEIELKVPSFLKKEYEGE